MDDPKTRFKTIINSIKITNIVEELVKQELLHGRPLTLDEYIPAIKNKMFYYNNKTDTLQQIKILAIRPFESLMSLIKDSLELYHSLGTDLCKQVSVYDYMCALKGRYHLHQTHILRVSATIEEACQVAKNFEYWQKYNVVTAALQVTVAPSNFRLTLLPPCLNIRTLPCRRLLETLPLLILVLLIWILLHIFLLWRWHTIPAAILLLLIPPQMHLTTFLILARVVATSLDTTLQILGTFRKNDVGAAVN